MAKPFENKPDPDLMKYLGSPRQMALARIKCINQVYNTHEEELSLDQMQTLASLMKKAKAELAQSEGIQKETPKDLVAKWLSNPANVEAMKAHADEIRPPMREEIEAIVFGRPRRDSDDTSEKPINKEAVNELNY